MNFSFHNKIEIKSGDNTYTFYNTMLKNVYSRLSNLKQYNKFLSLGTGNSTNYSSTYKLDSFLKAYPLSIEYLQNDTSNGDTYIKKSIVIEDISLDGIYITEAGISFDSSDNPTIYNYFSLIDDSTPNGVLKEKGKPLIISVYIYLKLSSSSLGLLTAGPNKFINFLLGEGLEDASIYAARGDNYTDNVLTFRENLTNAKKYLCNINFTLNEELTIEFSSDLLTGETNEIVFLISDSPFARINVQNYKESISETKTLTSTTHYVVDVGSNVKELTSIFSSTSSTNEINTVYPIRYAEDFADRITLPFNNLFNAETARFVSKDGDKIFFVSGDNIYGYKNQNYNITQLNLGNLSVQNITKIISFDDYIFIVTKLNPYIFCYKLNSNSITKCSLDLSPVEFYDELSNIYDIDITLSKSGVFMLGIITGNSHAGHSIYLSFDNLTNAFNLENTISTTNYYFSYVLAMYKNNYSDAQNMFLQSGEYSSDCRLVIHNPSGEIKDIYTVVAYYFTKDTKEVYTKNRAVIVEKTTAPYFWIYYYPQIYRYNLSLLQDEVDDYISTNLLYLIQKLSDGNYKIYNLVGYENPSEFKNGFPLEVNQSKIEDFEFLNDTLLIFTSDENERIIAYNLKQDLMAIENVSLAESEYKVSLQKYDLIGKNNEGVIVTFKVTISVWYF